jgi:hypothetical protein
MGRRLRRMAGYPLMTTYFGIHPQSRTTELSKRPPRLRVLRPKRNSVFEPNNASSRNRVGNFDLDQQQLLLLFVAVRMWGNALALSIMCAARLCTLKRGSGWSRRRRLAHRRPVFTRTTGSGATLHALSQNHTAVDARVERSLYQRAVGYSYDAVKIFCKKDGEIFEAPYVEHVPPDVTACIFWLKNRDPAHWRDAWQVDHTLGKYIISDPADERGTMDSRARDHDRRDAEETRRIKGESGPEATSP